MTATSCIDIYVAGKHEGEYWLTDEQIEKMGKYLARMQGDNLK